MGDSMGPEKLGTAAVDTAAAVKSCDSDTQLAAQSQTLVEVKGRKRRKYSLDGKTGSLSVEQAALTREHLAVDFVEGIKGFILPRGFPNSVSEDYLTYQLWAVPSHIAGWISVSLATSSLLKAVGIGTSAVGTAAATASIKWITKDGIGAAGRLLVGGRLGNVFDEDPKRWRMTAEVFATLGLALEIATAVFPGSFLVLAGAGNFSKALGKGLGRPCFRIIQTHFARQNNVGDISAKEEVWEVAAQLTGLGLSIAILKAIEATGNPSNVLWVWASVQSVHVALRYQALQSLQFPCINQKRACALVNAHVRGERLPGIAEANQAEPILRLPSQMRPSVKMGASIAEVFGDSPSPQELQPLLETLGPALQQQREQYLLLWREGRGLVLLRESAKPQDLLRAMWQAAWLDHCGIQTATSADVAASIEALQHQFPDFLMQAEAAGWNTQDVVIRSGSSRIAAGNL
ncbi:hypothetical protein WJX72_012310 [[Myrmecia] bisecta]|uniref:Uncharacterized protein n=1 Tax=[Myrmecia] bisecta TaxID=41462 RepID=A0AAW1PD21_9CHLO